MRKFSAGAVSPVGGSHVSPVPGGIPLPIRPGAGVTQSLLKAGSQDALISSSSASTHNATVQATDKPTHHGSNDAMLIAIPTTSLAEAQKIIHGSSSRTDLSASNVAAHSGSASSGTGKGILSKISSAVQGSWISFDIVSFHIRST
jgi:hypothetical protein